MPADVKRAAAKGYRYVFVGGFMNEGMSEYFKQNARELQSDRSPRKAIHYIYPSSHETIEGNAAAVRERFREVRRSGPGKTGRDRPQSGRVRRSRFRSRSTLSSSRNISRHCS